MAASSWFMWVTEMAASPANAPGWLIGSTGRIPMMLTLIYRRNIHCHMSAATDNVAVTVGVPETMSSRMGKIEKELFLRILKVTEAGAVAAARWIGHGDRDAADDAAVEAMRRVFAQFDIDGEIVIGEGERDEAPMLYIGEKVGTGKGPKVSIAVDPLEGTNLAAENKFGAAAVMAVAEPGGLLRAPDIYLDKLIVGPEVVRYEKKTGKHIDLDASPEHNLNIVAEALHRRIEDIIVVILERSRHEELIKEVREAGAKVRLVTDGDLMPGVAAGIRGTNVHVVMGIGAAPEGVLTAAALRTTGGKILSRFVLPAKANRKSEAEIKNEYGRFMPRLLEMGITDIDKLLYTEDLAPGKDVIFSATGVTQSDLFDGVNFFENDGARVRSVVMGSGSGTVRFIDTIYVLDKELTPVRLR